MIATDSSRKRYIQILLLFAYFTAFSDAGISCESDQFCQDLYQTADSVCLSSTKECSNPFRKGCLRSKGVKTEKWNYAESYRVCTSAEESISISNNNTSDDKEDNDVPCNATDFPYPEIRIHNGDWASSLILSWIYQIVLVEMVGVPATVGLSTDSVQSTGFYSANLTFQYSPVTYPFEALKVANAKMFGEENCEHTQEPCVHVIPEIWSGQIDRWEELVEQQAIDPPSGNGIVHKPSLMIPKKTAQEFPSLGLFYGLQGDKNREFLAQIFKKPTKWVDFCEKVSLTNCSVPDNTTATRYPKEEEKSLYFLEGSYNGYFMANDCSANNSTNTTDATNSTNVTDPLNVNDCHGYVIGPPCDWSAYVETQIYWNDIPLKLDSPDENTLSHSSSSMIEIWKAANATGSHVIMWWYLSSLEAQAFGNSSYSPQKVQLPQPSLECLENRPTVAARCSADPIKRRGSPLGACDHEFSQLQRLIARAVNQLNDQKSPVDRSPATETLKELKVSEYDILEILRKMLADGEDQVANNAREAVCDWVVDHIHELEEIIPRDFPKRITTAFNFGIGHYLAQAMAVVVGCIAVVCIILTYRYSETKTMIFAQPTFMYLIMFGFCIICFAAFMLAVVPRDSVCLAIKWMEVVGFGIQLIPVMIKTAALNRLISSSKKQQRININRRSLLRKVTMWMALIVACLLAWTYTDPPKAEEYKILDKKDPHLVIIDRECKSDKIYWEVIQSAMELVLLFICAILAFQSRNAISVVNDSRVLAQLVYSHFLFVILRVLVTAFDLSDRFLGDLIPILASFNHSCDALFAMCIYVVPKIIKAKYEEPNYNRGIPERNSSTRLKIDKHLKVLICTANMGNAEPTRESMEAWIPADGACYNVTPLPMVRDLKTGHFDIIVIGMQESTWVRRGRKALAEKEAAKSKGISEEDILNALDDHDSATLRVMIQDILGSDYLQIVEELRGQMRLSIWASANVEEHIKNVKISGANTGIGNVLANKGGIVATFTYKTTRLSFISAHLAAHEGENYYKNRLNNIRSILREGKTSELSSKLDVTMTSHHMFLLGDLNFRTKFEEDDLTHEKSVQRAMNLVDFKDFEGLYMYDELQQGIKNGEMLYGFDTLPCDFPPTFKVEREAGFIYKKQRVPSYTDRILHKSMDGFQSHLETLAYEPCPDFITSDHKPIRGAYSILPTDEVKPRIIQGTFILKLARIQASDLPSSDSSGKSDPYIMLMWEGIDLVAHKMGFRDKLRRYYNGQFWPRTKHLNRTLAPDWGDEVIHVEAESPMIRKGSLIHVVVMDRDKVTKDDFLCAATLSLWDFCNHGTTTHDISLPLTREGTLAGRINFKMYVGIPEQRARPVGRIRRASLTLGRVVNHMFDSSQRDDHDEDQTHQTGPGPKRDARRASLPWTKIANMFAADMSHNGEEDDVVIRPATKAGAKPPPGDFKSQQAEKQSKEVLNALFDESARTKAADDESAILRRTDRPIRLDSRGSGSESFRKKDSSARGL